MTRWRRLRENVGTGAAVRTAVVALLFGALAVGAGVSLEDPVPLLAYALGTGLPAFARRMLVAHFDQTALALRISGFGIVAGAFAAGWARGRLWEEDSAVERWLLSVMILTVATYVSAFFWTYSEPEVVRLDAAAQGPRA